MLRGCFLRMSFVCGNELCKRSVRDVVQQDVVVLHQDPYDEEEPIVFCCKKCSRKYEKIRENEDDVCFENCVTCKRKIASTDGSYHCHFKEYYGQTSSDEMCTRCFYDNHLLQHGFSRREMQKWCYIVNCSYDFTDKRLVSEDARSFKVSPKEYGYVRPADITHLSNITEETFTQNEHLVQEFSQHALRHIDNGCQVLVLLDGVDPQTVSLWVYGLYHKQTRDAVIAWMLCSKMVLSTKGYACPKDIARIIGKFVYSSRNNELWARTVNLAQSPKKLKR